MDFEKLELFYLGRRCDAQSGARTDAPLLYDSPDLVTHAVIVGMTGSGKTGLGIGLMEEAAIDNVPVLAIDPKGDLGNLLLTFPGLSVREFAPWVNPDEARAASQSVDAFADAEATRWSKGLADWGQDGARIARLKSAADFTIYTPGSVTGHPISIVKSFAAPSTAVMDDPELFGDRVSTAATCVLTLAGVNAEPLRSREHILVSSLFADAWQAGRALDLGGLIAAVQNPTIAKVGVMDLESFFPSKDRFGLAMQLNQLLAAPGYAAWLQGEPLDIDRLLYTADGKPRVSIISIAHLDDQQRMFFVSLLLNELVAWVRAQRGTSTLRALVYFDEIFGYLPPVANPPSKAPLLLLLKQARAFGVGVVLATQNPVDLDYKALANCGTWMLGRLQTERDKARVLDGLEGAAANTGEGFDRGELDRLLSGLGKRRFLLHNVHDKEPILFETRWTMSYLRGPLGRDEIRTLSGGGAAVARSGAMAASTPVTTTAPAATTTRATEASAPMLHPDIKSFFAAGRGARYEPFIVGVARLGYADVKLGLDDARDVTVMTPVTDGAVAVDWEQAEPADFSAADLSPAPTPGMGWATLPAAAARAVSYRAWEREFVRWAAQSQTIEVWRSLRAKIVSRPDESERDFRIRLQTEMREGRDAALARVRAKYEAKVRVAEEKVRLRAAAVQRESAQASESKVSVALSLGATVLGALLGRKAVSATTLGRATTAARGVGRASREAQDVGRAQATVDAAGHDLTELQSAFEAELQDVKAQWDATSDELERVVVKPRRGGVSVQLLALVWVPRP